MKTAEDMGFNLREGQQEVEVLAKIVRQRGTPRDDAKTQQSQPDFEEQVPIGMRKKS